MFTNKRIIIFENNIHWYIYKNSKWTIYTHIFPFYF